MCKNRVVNQIWRNIIEFLFCIELSKKNAVEKISNLNLSQEVRFWFLLTIYINFLTDHAFYTFGGYGMKPNERVAIKRMADSLKTMRIPDSILLFPKTNIYF